MKYSCENPKKKIAIIGKVITFDSGGLDIKPASSMLTMKDDMSGAACVLGVIAGGGDEDKIEAAAQYAAGIGLAFQIRDDILDVIGTQEEMGKGVGTDANKNTFVRLYGLEKCEELVQKYTDLAINALDVFEDTEYLITLANALVGRTT